MLSVKLISTAVKLISTNFYLFIFLREKYMSKINTKETKLIQTKLS